MMKKLLLAAGLLLSAHEAYAVPELTDALVAECAGEAERAVQALENCDGSTCGDKVPDFEVEFLDGEVGLLRYSVRRSIVSDYVVSVRQDEDGKDCLIAHIEWTGDL